MDKPSSMKMFFCYFLCWIFFPNIKLCAQKSELSGIIISNSGDTIACTFYKKNWKKQPFEIGVNLAGRDSILYPADIKGFRIPSSKIEYVSKKIQIVQYNESLENATFGKEPYMDSLRWILLLPLYKGLLNLYSYTDRLDKKHFFIEADNKIIEIYAHVYMVSANDPHFIVPVTNARVAILPYKQYINCLKGLMLNCDDVFSMIDEMSLDKKSLIKLLNAYSNCLSKKKSN